MNNGIELNIYSLLEEAGCLYLLLEGIGDLPRIIDAISYKVGTMRTKMMLGIFKTH